MRKTTIGLIIAFATLLIWFFANGQKVRVGQYFIAKYPPKYFINMLLDSGAVQGAFKYNVADTTISAVSVDRQDGQYILNIQREHSKESYQLSFDSLGPQEVKVGLYDERKFKNPVTMLWYTIVKTNGKSKRIKKIMKGASIWYRGMNEKISVDTLDDQKIEYEGLYAYLEIKTTVREKAKNMIRNNSFLLQMMSEHQLKNVGFPFNYITSWNHKNDSIEMRFCFPISQKLDLGNGLLKIDSLHVTSAKHAIYHGNYMFSDLAWNLLLPYSKDGAILEFFKNNPMEGGDDSTWRADIYITR